MRLTPKALIWLKLYKHKMQSKSSSNYVRPQDIVINFYLDSIADSLKYRDWIVERIYYSLIMDRTATELVLLVKKRNY